MAQQQNITIPIDAQKKLQELSEEYQKLQNDISNAVQTRQRLTAQQTENQSVSTVFTNLPDDEEKATVYKLTGPVLLKTGRVEARETVEGRLRLVRGEVERVDKQIQEWSEKSEGRRDEIMRIQSEAQAAQQGQSGG